MKRSISVITVTALLLGAVFMLTGCSAQKKLVGTWETPLNLAQAMMDEMDLGEELGGELGEDFAIDSFNVTMVLELRDDGTYTASIDETSMNAAFDSLLAHMETALRATTKKELEAVGAGMSAEQVLALLGMDMDSLINSLMDKLESVLQEQGIINQVLQEARIQGKWTAKDDKLYLSDEPDDEIDEDAYEVYRLEGNRMIWSFHVGDDTLELGSIYPVKWEKAA